jgi:hypothetical protein
LKLVGYLEALEKELCEGVKLLRKDYPDDVDIIFTGDIKFHAYIKQSYSDKVHLCPQDLYLVIFQDTTQVALPNVEVILKLFLSLMMKNSSEQRSFSQLKSVKNEMQPSQLQEKLSSPSIICLESHNLHSLSFYDIIHDFTLEKSLNKMF